jgi:predicted AAA+ superfamily ATPase
VGFDEVHKVPEIFNAIKLAVDQDRENYGKFVLSSSGALFTKFFIISPLQSPGVERSELGSYFTNTDPVPIVQPRELSRRPNNEKFCKQSTGQFALQKQVSESLAGRIGMLSLLPFQFSEIPEALHEASIFRGGYPELVNRGYAHSEEWFGAYLETYLDKDIRSVYRIGDMRDFRRFLTLLAGNISQLLNLSRFASELGVAVNTIKQWVSVLEASYAIFLLQPYHDRKGKRLTKSPKVYFWDTGLASYLTGIQTKKQYESSPLVGFLFENYIMAEVHKWMLHTQQRLDASFLRTSTGDEIDLILSSPQKTTLIEIKSSATFKFPMVQLLQKYRSEKEDMMLVYRGESRELGPDLAVKNYSSFLRELSATSRPPFGVSVH